VVTAKGYGATNLVALDRSGAVLLERLLLVESPKDVVVVYRGLQKNTYSCAPDCEQRLTLGDAPAYFDATLAQIVNRNGQALGAQQSSR
jgi:hypothetical protein